MNTYLQSMQKELLITTSTNHPQMYSIWLTMLSIKIRLPHLYVMDGSIKSMSGVSLNDQLLVGPTTHPPLNDVLIRFRRYPYVLTMDISKMYRAVSLAPEDRDFHRFLWRPAPNNQIVYYPMTRVIFGIASVAFLATKAVTQLAEENEAELPLASKAIEESFYVDDGLPSVKTQQEAIPLFHQLQQLFARGQFKLHKWGSHSSEVLNVIPPEVRNTETLSNFRDIDQFTKILGMEYNSKQDYSPSPARMPHLRKNHLQSESYCLMQRKPLILLDF